MADMEIFYDDLIIINLYILFMIKPLEKLLAKQRYHNSALELLLLGIS